jgi:hypothetical protein
LVSFERFDYLEFWIVFLAKNAALEILELFYYSLNEEIAEFFTADFEKLIDLFLLVII